jgi:hypothetical protein
MSHKKMFLTLAAIVALGLAYAFFGGASAQDYRSLSRAPVGLAPDPKEVREAVVQVYSARAARWRGNFAVHTWIAVKPTDAPAFTVYEVIGWYAMRGQPSLAVSNRPADGRWFGNGPELLADKRGAGVDALIQRIDAAARRYPYGDDYLIWPGPNSNTFVASVLREVPELRVDMPPTAIGKDFIPGGIAAPTPSGTGYQVSLFGLASVLVGIEEGFEVGILGLTFGVDPKDLAIKLPLIGRIGFTGDKVVGSTLTKEPTSSPETAETR